MHSYHTNKLISSEPFFQTMACSTQGQCIVCCFLCLLCPNSFYFTLSSWEPQYQPCRNQVPGSYWLLNPAPCAATYANGLLLSSLFTEEMHKRCCLRQQEPSEGQKVFKPLSWLLFMGTRLWKWYYTVLFFFPPLLSHHPSSGSGF